LGRRRRPFRHSFLGPVFEMVERMERADRRRERAREYYRRHRNHILERAKARYNPVMYACCIGIKRDMAKKLAEICKDISERDPTFKFRFYESKFPVYDLVLICFAEPNEKYPKSKDRAHAIGLLITRKYAPKEWGLLYWVKRVTAIKRFGV